MGVPCNPFPKWFSANVRHNLNKVCSTRKQLKKHPTVAREAKLLCLERSLQAQIDSPNNLSLVSSFSSEPGKPFHNLNDLSRPSVRNLFIGPDSEFLRGPSGISCAFNIFFHSTFTNFVLPPMAELPAPSSHLSSISIDASDTFTVLSRLDQDKAIGCDKIIPKILRACASSCQSLCPLYSTSA